MKMIIFIAIAIKFALNLSANFEKGVLIYGVLILAICLENGQDLNAIYPLFEATLFVALPFLAPGTRSWRKNFAMISLLFISLIGTITFLGQIEIDFNFNLKKIRVIAANCWLLLLIFLKTPTFPFTFWLPEAHVEATFLGSIFLASFVLKFSLFFLSVFIIKILDTIFWILFFSLFTLYLVISQIYNCDMKKLGANLSIFHMNLGFFLNCLLNFYSFIFIDYVFFGHSVLAMFWFAVIGFLYSISGSRMIFGLNISNYSYIFILLVIFLLIFNIGLPIGPVWNNEILFWTTLISFSFSLFYILLIFLQFLIIIPLASSCLKTLLILPIIKITLDSNIMWIFSSFIYMLLICLFLWLD